MDNGQYRLSSAGQRDKKDRMEYPARRKTGKAGARLDSEEKKEDRKKQDVARRIVG
jgi:hypothetical protein